MLTHLPCHRKNDPLWRKHRIRPTPALTLEGQLRVDLRRSPTRPLNDRYLRTPDGSNRRQPDITFAAVNVVVGRIPDLSGLLGKVRSPRQSRHSLRARSMLHRPSETSQSSERGLTVEPAYPSARLGGRMKGRKQRAFALRCSPRDPPGHSRATHRSRGIHQKIP